jgi:hypothetical protein
VNVLVINEKSFSILPFKIKLSIQLDVKDVLLFMIKTL